jgi:hypothetical protein
MEEKVISDCMIQNAFKILNVGVFVSIVIKNILHFTALQAHYFFIQAAPPLSLVSSVIAALSQFFSSRQHIETCGGQDVASELPTDGKVLAKDSPDNIKISVGY